MVTRGRLDLRHFTLLEQLVWRSDRAQMAESARRSRFAQRLVTSAWNSHQLMWVIAERVDRGTDVDHWRIFTRRGWRVFPVPVAADGPTPLADYRATHRDCRLCGWHDDLVGVA